MKASYRGDRHAFPVEHEVRYLSFEECSQIAQYSRVNVLDRYGRIAEVKITSIKRWKTHPEIEIRWKYGLYEYGGECLSPGTTSRLFIKILEG